MLIQFTLNGRPVAVEAAPHITLLSLLRDHLNLTGTKEGCGVGECGACSVLVDGELVNSCLMLAPKAEGRTILTIEGVGAADGGAADGGAADGGAADGGAADGGASDGALSDLQQNFIHHGAVQCGFCTPGMVLAGEALLAHTPAPTRDEIRTALSGNLCRCTGYQQIIDAIEETATGRLKKAAEPAIHGV